MPESDGERKITLIDVVTNFGFSSINNLFPVSQNFEQNTNVVNREQLDNIVSAIEQNNTYLPICIHGGAGIGKSTIINQVKNRLPEYSECILFDCYGAGKYQNPEDKRHLHRKAITQIANDSPINYLNVGNIIIEAQKRAIKTVGDLEIAVSAAMKSSDKTLLIVIYNNQNQRRYIGVKLK